MTGPATTSTSTTQARRPNRSIGVTVIAGYLGAGKTTLVNHILREGTGRKTVVLVNDFGAVSIDEALIADTEGGNLALSNGCVCCRIDGTLSQMLLGIGARPNQPEHVIIEASGVSDPGPIVSEIAVAGFSLDGVVIVADAETVRTMSTNGYVGTIIRRQLKGADLLVLNKLDLIPESDLPELKEWARQAAPGAAVVGSVEARVPTATLLGIHIEGDASGPSPTHEAHVEHVTWSWRSDKPMERERLERWVANLPEGVVRAKGIVPLQDDPEARWVLQVVGRRSRLERGEPWGDSDPAGRLVVIGLPDCVEPEAPFEG